MRAAVAIPVSAALFQAFLLAPVQHVHEGADGDDHGGHEHSTVIHSHFSPHKAVPLRGHGPAITDNDGGEAWDLDTFTLVLPLEMHAAAPSPAPDSIYAPRVVVGAVVAVEERAHDPPARAPVLPRAPPV